MTTRFCSFILILLTIIVLALAAHPASAQGPAPLSLEEARLAAQQRLGTEVTSGHAPGWGDAFLNEPILLYDLNGVISAYLFPVSRDGDQAGYLTVAAASIPNPVLEFATEGAFPLALSQASIQEQAAAKGYRLVSERPLYLGLLSYSYEVTLESATGDGSDLSVAAEDRYVVDLLSGQISQVDPSQAGKSLVETIDPSFPETADISVQAYTVISGVPDQNQFWGSYGCYSGCAPTSGTNVMGYWDGKGYGNLISGSDWQGAVNQMRTAMGTYCSDGGGWTSVGNISSGITSYAESHGYYFTSEFWTPSQVSYTKYQNEINAGQPLAVDLIGHVTYGNHTVAGVGYNTSGNYLIIHDNWPSTGENVSVQYGSGYSSVYMHPVYPDTVAPSSYVYGLPANSSPSFSVSWTGTDNSGGSGIACYDIQVKINSSGTWSTWRSCTSATSATYTGSEGNTYYFRSRAKDRAGNWESYPSSHDAYTTVGPVTPAMPGNLRVSGVGASSISLAWTDNSSNESGFKIYKWDYNGSSWDFWYLTSVGANVTSFTDTGLTCGWDYFYQISAYNSAGESSRTGWVEGTTTACPDLVYTGHLIDDDSYSQSSGNGDGIVDCGENIELYINLRNQGGSTATGVNTTISTADPYVTWLYNTSSSYPDMGVNGTGTNSNDFDFALASDTPDGHWLQFNLVTTASNGGPWYDSFSVPVSCYVAPGDGYEPDNTWDQASWIYQGTPQTHSIIPVGDEDWLWFSVTERSEVVIETSGSSGDTQMWLYDGALNMIDFDDDSGSGYFSRIQRTCSGFPLAPGIYYVKVDELGGNEEISSYDVNLTLSECSSDSLYLPLVIK